MYDQPKVAIRHSSLRVSAPYVLLVFVLIWSLQNILISVQSFPGLRGFDEITVSEKRLSPLKSDLPQFGVIGYLTHGGEFPANVIVDRAETKSYYIAQYALSPLVLSNSKEPKFVIGDFSRRTNPAAVSERYQLKVVKDLRSGVILFENK